MTKINYFAYICVALTIGLVYTLGELKYEKKVAKSKELFLLQDTGALEEQVYSLQEHIQVIEKQNKEYQIILGIIKLKMDESKKNPSVVPPQNTTPPQKDLKPLPQATIPRMNKDYPGTYIPKGHPYHKERKYKI